MRGIVFKTYDKISVCKLAELLASIVVLDVVCAQKDGKSNGYWNAPHYGDRDIGPWLFRPVVAVGEWVRDGDIPVAFGRN